MWVTFDVVTMGVLLPDIQVNVKREECGSRLTLLRWAYDVFGIVSMYYYFAAKIIFVDTMIKIN